MPGNGGETHVAMERCDRVLARSTKVPSGTEKADDITGHKRRARGTANTLISVPYADGVAEARGRRKRTWIARSFAVTLSLL